MILQLTVTQPILGTGQQLKVEYSIDGVNYTFDSYQTTNTFDTTYAGFTSGTLYYFRFTLVKSLSPLVECESVIAQKLLPEEIYCLLFSADLTNVGDVWNLEITYTTPSPYNAPCGGYILKYGTVLPLQSISYSTLPTSPIILPASNQTYYVEIYALDCEGNQVLCEEFTLIPEPAGCEHAVISDSDLSQSSGNFYLVLTVVPSTPPSSIYKLTYSQANAVSSGVPDPGATVNFNATGANPETFTVQVYPNTNVLSNVISYIGSLTDDCKYNSRFDVSMPI